jgi:NADH:ubiquinone oxidoreductase subunit F (NADH-binding)
VTDPDSIEDYLQTGGYEGLRRALSLDPDGVIELASRSGLRGRGGAGFPVAAKWRSAREATGEPRYVVCNAAEGDIGAFMDRYILDNDPHAVLEGMLIAGYAVGACRGYVYVRAEYDDLIPRLRHAVENARESGFIGDRVAGSTFGFDIQVARTAGGYVCGEETALLNSLEGRRGTPRLRPPFPTQAGLNGRPTVVNNVKTLAYVPLILRHGPEWFAEVGTEQSKGTAVLSLAGDIARPGVVEVPMGTPLREVVLTIGGGVAGGGALKTVQTGGPMGGVIPACLLDTPVAFETMAAIGSPLGSGGLIVYGDHRCMVAVADEYARFACEESCGHCAPCRLGTAQVAAIVHDIRGGRANEADLELLARIARTLRYSAFCAFGQGACQVVVSTLEHFRPEYDEHIRDHQCRCGECEFAEAS